MGLYGLGIHACGYCAGRVYACVCVCATMQAHRLCIQARMADTCPPCRRPQCRPPDGKDLVCVCERVCVYVLLCDVELGQYSGLLRCRAGDQLDPPLLISTCRSHAHEEERGAMGEVVALYAGVPNPKSRRGRYSAVEGPGGWGKGVGMRIQCAE